MSFVKIGSVSHTLLNGVDEFLPVLRIQFDRSSLCAHSVVQQLHVSCQSTQFQTKGPVKRCHCFLFLLLITKKKKIDTFNLHKNSMSINVAIIGAGKAALCYWRQWNYILACAAKQELLSVSK